MSELRSDFSVGDEQLVHFAVHSGVGVQYNEPGKQVVFGSSPEVFMKGQTDSSENMIIHVTNRGAVNTVVYHQEADGIFTFRVSSKILYPGMYESLAIRIGDRCTLASPLVMEKIAEIVRVIPGVSDTFSDNPTPVTLLNDIDQEFLYMYSMRVPLYLSKYL